jgi:ABC-type multidrug transport system fused ATPase/permease subunit
VARALLLKGTGVFLLDEATSSLDDTTDKEVERAIEQHGRGATVIKVAHRVSTVLTCDRIAVVDDGRIVELDSPDVLRNSGGIFARMCAQTTFE